jgi:hypothetical protein
VSIFSKGSSKSSHWRHLIQHSSVSLVQLFATPPKLLPHIRQIQIHCAYMLQSVLTMGTHGAAAKVACNQQGRSSPPQSAFERAPWGTGEHFQRNVYKTVRCLSLLMTVTL